MTDYDVPADSVQSPLSCQSEAIPSICDLEAEGIAKNCGQIAEIEGNLRQSPRHVFENGAKISSLLGSQTCMDGITDVSQSLLKNTDLLATGGIQSGTEVMSPEIATKSERSPLNESIVSTSSSAAPDVAKDEASVYAPNPHPFVKAVAELQSSGATTTLEIAQTTDDVKPSSIECSSNANLEHLASALVMKEAAPTRTEQVANVTSALEHPSKKALNGIRPLVNIMFMNITLI